MSITKLLKELGKEYKIVNIDFERCLYRDFGNGFNVEISGVGHGNSKRPLTIYLWFGTKQPECLIVKTIKDVPKSAESIRKATESLRDYSESLRSQGYDTRDKLFYLKNPESRPENLR